MITSLADVQRLEQLPYEQAIPARTTYGLIAAAAARHAGRTAFSYLPSGDTAAPPVRVSYAQLLANIHRAANLFRSLGVGPDDAVAILAPNIPETHYALWGAQVAGRACPINYLLQPDHIAALLKASGARLLVALGPNDELDVWSTVQKVRALHDIPVLQIAPGRFEQLDAQPAELTFDPALSPDRIAAFFHTGGTPLRMVYGRDDLQPPPARRIVDVRLGNPLLQARPEPHLRRRPEASTIETRGRQHLDVVGGQLINEPAGQL